MKLLSRSRHQCEVLQEQEPVISPNYQSYEHCDRIDWTAATPSWSSIITGVILPILATVALVFTIDIVLCWVFEQSIGYFWAAPLWLVATMALPLALIGTVIIAKIFLLVSTN
jgi:hypothetical protein